MSELCISKCHFSRLVISDFILLCSFILSHPLYFSYFIFFSPYLIKLLSFLSPLFLTTFLLSLAFIAGFESSQTLFTSILRSLQFKKDHCPNEEDDLGIYEIMFGPPSMAAVTQEEDPSQILDQIQTQKKDCILEPNPLPGSEMEDPIVVAKAEDLEEGKVSLSSKSEIPCAVVMEEKRLENFLKILDEFERLTSNAEEKTKKKTKKQEPPRGGAKSDKVVEKQKSLFMNVGSEAVDRSINSNESPSKLELSAKENPAMAKSQSQRIITAAADEGLSSYGSMRREREWKRTLACKLFEERHNGGGGGGGGGEAMDSLWEAYEVDSEKLNKKRGEKAKRKEEREWEEEDEVGGAQLCCLQALKLSAGKMNLGVGKPNLVKISKAIKGIGWLHSLTKNSKKVHNNGDHRYY